MKSLISIFLVSIISLSSKQRCLGSGHRHGKQSLFIFGDSTLDAGNNNYINTTSLDQANFYPYGTTFFHFPTGRFSDGRLISDFLAEHANLPLIGPFLNGGGGLKQGVNFASAGGGALVETFQGSVIDLHMQVRNYHKVVKWMSYKFGERKARNRIKKAVYLFSIASNDYMSLFLTNSSFLNAYTPSKYVHMVIANISSVITEIYKSGGRKFAMLNVPAADCSPALRLLNLNATGNGGCLKQASIYITLHNKALLQLLKQLSIKLPEFKYSLYDFNAASLERINKPSLYGYKEGKTACCGTGQYNGVFSCGGKRLVKQYELCQNIEDHVFWDSFHMTEKANHQIADEMWTNPTLHHQSSYTIKDLFYFP